MSQRALDTISPALGLRRSECRANRADVDAGLGQGVFAVDRTLGSGYAQQWNGPCSENCHKTMVEAGTSVKHHARRDPGHQPQSVTANQLARGRRSLSGAESYFGIIPRSSSLGDPLSRRQLLSRTRIHVGRLYRNNVGPRGITDLN